MAPGSRLLLSLLFIIFGYICAYNFTTILLYILDIQQSRFVIFGYIWLLLMLIVFTSANNHHRYLDQPQ